MLCSIIIHPYLLVNQCKSMHKKLFTPIYLHLKEHSVYLYPYQTSFLEDQIFVLLVKAAYIPATRRDLCFK